MRSLWKGLAIKPLKSETLRGRLVFWQRWKIITNTFFRSRRQTQVHNGLRFKAFRHKTTLIIGSRLGEFVRTRRSFLHRKQKKKKKKKK